MKKFLKIMLGLTLTVALVACGGSDDGDKVEVVVGSGADVVSFDPHISNDNASSRVRVNLYEGLVRQDADLVVQPLVAKEWENEGKEWTFYLNEGVLFHNGEEVKASDVVYSIERAQESTDVGHLVGSIASVEEIDDYTVKITTSEVDLGILPALAHPTIAVLSEAVVEEQGDDYASGFDGNNPVGTGPFSFVNSSKGSVELETYEDYWNEDKMPNFDLLTFKSYADNSARKLAVEAGDIDIAYDIQNSDYDSVEANSDLTVVKDYDLSYAYAGFNMENEKFSDVRVREAINLAVNFDEIIDAPTIMNGLATRANTPLSIKAAGHNDEIEAYEYDPERAKELLEEAGVTDLEFTIITNENATRVAIATVMQAQLDEVGIKVNVEQMEWGAYLDATANGDHEMFILGWTAVTGDPTYGITPLFHTENMGSAGNRTFYSNSELDALLEEAYVADNEEERYELYGEAQQMIMDDYIHVPFYYQERVAAMRNNISGFVLHPSGSYELYSVEKE